MRKPITVELDEHIINRITIIAERQGLTIEEVIRSDLGNHFMEIPSVSYAPIPIQKDPNEFLARIVSAQGMAKCTGCLQKLDSASLLSGICCTCGEKI